jgi:hypothetical protein
MALLEIMQVGLVDVAPLAVLITLTLTLLLLSLSLTLTIVLVLFLVVVVVVVESSRSKQSGTSGILASSTVGPLGLDRAEHIFRGDARLLAKRLDSWRVRRRKSTEHGNGEQLVIKWSLPGGDDFRVCRAHPSQFLDGIFILSDTCPPNEFHTVSRFLQRRCTTSLLELILGKKSVRREGICGSM